MAKNNGPDEGFSVTLFGVTVELRRETEDERKARVEKEFREWWDKGTKKYVEDRK